MSVQFGYYCFPSVCKNRVVFACENDLWTVPTDGGIAVRLTTNLDKVSHPFLSPDGNDLAFIGWEEGYSEVYWMPADGGVAKRLTFLRANITVVGWSLDGKSILFASRAGQPFRDISNIYQIDRGSGSPQRLPVGLANQISYGANGGVVISRSNTWDSAYWKSYRAGTAGVIWIDRDGNGDFQPLIDLPGDLSAPMWVGDRIFFLSDHESIGNLYSCTLIGTELIKHSNHTEYHVRHASSDGQSIVYHAGTELFLCNPSAEVENQLIGIEFHNPQVQRQRIFVDGAKFMEDYNSHPTSHADFSRDLFKIKIWR
jgi:tricorn protease